jgi:type I restriction enzyme S subunit
MNEGRLLAYYDRVADVPDAVARLRLFILDLAVRGTLVPQDSRDEPAAELLKRIATQKVRLVQEGRFKTLDHSFNRDEASFPFPIPANWTWCYLDDLAAIGRGGSPRPIQSYLTKDPNGIPWIKIGDSSRGSIYIDRTEERIIPGGLVKSRFVSPGDLLLSNSMSFGYPYITNIEGCIHDGWLVIRTPENLIDKLYLHKVFLSGYAKAAFSDAASGAVVQNLNADKARLLPVPLPPIAEQKRIVAKVDELMVLCDRQEAARAERERVRDRLAASSLTRLNAPDQETIRDDLRFALNALPALTARPDQIKQLRQTILNLAVRGKLVPQDPKDEPALELLKRITTEKSRLEKEGQAKRQEPLPKIEPDQAPFPLPFGWTWGRFPELGVFARGKSRHRPRNDPALFDGGTHLLIQTGDVARSNGVIATHTSRYNDFGLSQSHKWPKGTLCITIAANIADSGILTFDACFPDSVVGFIPASMFETARYFEYFVRTAKANLLEFAPATAQKNINLEILMSVVIPIPPLAEQQRIVAKVDEVMALCDQLEASLTDTAATRRCLLDALIAEARLYAPRDQSLAEVAFL